MLLNGIRFNRSEEKIIYYSVEKKKIELSAKGVEIIICNIHEFIENIPLKDLISLGIQSEKIDVIYNGLDHSYFYPHTELEGETVNISPFSIKRPFFIYASRLSGPEKKHIELIKAFSMFKKKTGLPHRLVLAGSEGSSLMH